MDVRSAPLLQLVTAGQPKKPTFTRPPAQLRGALARRTPLDPKTDKALIRKGDALLAAAEDEARETAAAARKANRSVAYLRRRPLDHAEACYERLRAYQNPRGLVSRWLGSGRRAALFVGPSRTGKSTAAYAICNEANDDGVWVEAWTAFDLWRTLRSEGDDGPCWSRVTSCDLLLLDDLGRERVTDAWREHLTEIMEVRWARRRRLIVTVNTPPDPEGAYRRLVDPVDQGGYGYGDPVVERILAGGGLVIFDGPPFRDLVADW